jgi:hypothetical protein
LKAALNSANEGTSESRSTAPCSLNDLIELQRKERKSIAPRDLGNSKRYRQSPLPKPS